MIDPLITIVGSGLLGATLASAALARALRRIPEARRRGAEWAALGVALLLAFGALLAVGDAGAGQVSGALLVGTLPFMI